MTPASVYERCADLLVFPVPSSAFGCDVLLPNVNWNIWTPGGIAVTISSPCGVWVYCSSPSSVSPLSKVAGPTLRERKRRTSVLRELQARGAALVAAPAPSSAPAVPSAPRRTVRTPAMARRVVCPTTHAASTPATAAYRSRKSTPALTDLRGRRGYAVRGEHETRCSSWSAA